MPTNAEELSRRSVYVKQHFCRSLRENFHSGKKINWLFSRCLALASSDLLHQLCPHGLLCLHCRYQVIRVGLARICIHVQEEYIDPDCEWKSYLKS